MDILTTSLKRYRKTLTLNEEGFTLLELIIVMVIISILAALVVPVFSAQQKEAMNASVKSDLRGAVTALITDATKNGGKFLSYLPTSITVSNNNHIYLDPEKSGQFKLCLVGYNKQNPDVYYYYDSLIGKVSQFPCSSLPVGALSFSAKSASDLAGKKALIVYRSGINPVPVVNNFRSFGYGTVDSIADSGFVNSSDASIAQYDLVLLHFYAWSNGVDVRNKALIYYNNGGKIIHDGNDATFTANPFVASQTFVSGGEADYIPSYASGSLNPSFPFTFRSSAFSSDGNWSCITELNSAVSLATTPKGNLTCHTMFAATNGSGGRWLYLTMYGAEAEANGAANAIRSWISQ